MRTEIKPLTVFLVAFSCLGSILYGYDIGIVNGALSFMGKDLNLTDTQLSLIAAAVLGGGCIATLVSGPLSDKFGRRTMMRLAAVVFLVGVGIILAAHSYNTAFIGRLVQGVGVGIITIVIPLYLVECTPSHVRGKVISLFQLFLTGGILLAYGMDRVLISTGNWRYMFFSIFVPGTLFLLGTLFLAESPRWLFSKGKVKKARSVLRRSHSNEETDAELEDMHKLHHEKEKMSLSKFFNHLGQRKYSVPFTIALSIAILGQLTGINSILQFSTLMLQHSGFASNKVSMMGSVGVGAVNFILTFVGLMLIDRIGRKPLLTIGTLGVIIALLFCGFVSLMPNTAHKGNLLTIGLVIYVGFFAVGPGIVVWLAISELMPMSIRGTGMAVCLFANSLASTLLAASVTHIAKWAGGYQGVFWLCAGFTVIYLLIAAFVLPETKNQTLEKIEMRFAQEK